MFDWLWPDWHSDRSGSARRVEIPEAGGWMYQFRGGDAIYSHVFVPDMAKWTIAIATAVNSDKPIAVILDFAHVTKTHQRVPTKRNS